MSAQTLDRAEVTVTFDVHQLDQVLLVGAAVMLIAILAVRASVRIGLPSLLLYLLMGVLLGESALGVNLTDPDVAHALGFAALVVILAEGGFTGSQSASMEQRYERAETELFARLEGVGREIENRVTGNDSNRLQDQGLKAETASAAGYGSAAHHEAFAESLGNSGANETQIRGRLAAARSEGTHPSAAVAMGSGAAKARKSRAGAAMGAERGKGGLYLAGADAGRPAEADAAHGRTVRHR